MIRWKLGRTRAVFLAVCATALVVGVALVAGVGFTQAAPQESVDIQILSVSDWHAQLDPLFVFGEGTFGGPGALLPRA